MLFNSWEYGALLISTFFIYYLSKRETFQVRTLVFSSLIFYGFNNPWLLILLLFSALLNSLTSFKVAKSEMRSEALIWATGGVTLNLLILGFFKYTPLIADSISESWRQNDGVGHFLTQIPLPIGISFFTFQGISLLVDVYRERYSISKQLPISSLGKHSMKTLFFIVFFPQLIAGPIVKAHDFYFQIRPKFLKDINWAFVIHNLVMGYFLKIVIADNLKDQTFWISYPYFQTLSSIDLLAMLLGYSCQIFADFCGYSLIALGCAEMFGYRLIQNFNWPYISRSFSEFWNRWHISLSSFLKEYLYIPLGGNRKGPWRTYLNLFIVMFLGGLWHGAAWSYAIWGSAHGLLLALERLLSGRLTKLFDWIPAKILVCLQIILVFSAVSFIWLLFRLPNFSEVLLFCKAILNNFAIPPGKTRVLLNLIYCLPIFLLHIYQFFKLERNFRINPNLKFVAYVFMFYLILTNGGNQGEFIYFQF